MINRVDEIVREIEELSRASRIEAVSSMYELMRYGKQNLEIESFELSLVDISAEYRYCERRTYHGDNQDHAILFPSETKKARNLVDELTSMDPSIVASKVVKYHNLCSSSAPSKAWKHGAPYRKLIAFMRRCESQIRDDKKKAEIERKKSEQLALFNARFNGRKKSAESRIRETARQLMIIASVK